MRIDRLWRAGPFRGGLLADLSTLLSLAPQEIRDMATTNEGKAALDKANSFWQSASGGRDMKADGVPVDARLLYTVLLGRGADLTLATKFVKSLRNVYANITFAPTKFDRLLRAAPCFINQMDGLPLSEFVAREMTAMKDSSNTGVVYIEVACRALIADNSYIVSKFYDEAEVVDVDTGPKREIPMKRPALSASKYLLLKQGDEGEMHVIHCPSSKVLSLHIDRDPNSVQGLIQTPNEFHVFRTAVSRKRWMYKHVLLAMMGASKAFWLRFGGILDMLLQDSFTKDQLVYIKRSSFDGMFPTLAAPILSDIPDNDWGRLGACSRIAHIGASVIKEKWEFEIVSINAIAELPAIDHDQEWLFLDESPYQGRKTTPVKFRTLPYDSANTRRIVVDEGEERISDVKERTVVDYGGVPASGSKEQVPPPKEDEPVSKQAAKKAKKPEKIKIVGKDTPDLTFEKLTLEEQAIFTAISPLVLPSEDPLRRTIEAGLKERGKLEAGQTLLQYVNKVYDELGLETLLAETIVMWNMTFSDGQKEIVRKRVGFMIAEIYINMFEKGQKGGTNE